MNLQNSFHSVGGSLGKRSKEEDSPRFRMYEFEGMMQQELEKQRPNQGNSSHREHRHNFQKQGFRRMLNSSSSNDRLMLPEMRNDSSMEIEGQQNYETENSQESEPMRRSFLKREQSLSVLNSRRGESSESLSDCKSLIDKLCRQQPEKTQNVGCRCKRSKCLKLYCQCFHSKAYCGQFCGCYDCGNKQGNHEHQQAIYEALSRNPKAFEQELQKQNTIKAEGKVQGFSLCVAPETVKRGCKCRKTKCLKKYCQCYNNQQRCGVFCKCQGCENIDSEMRMQTESLSQSRVKA